MKRTIIVLALVGAAVFASSASAQWVKGFKVKPHPLYEHQRT